MNCKLLAIAKRLNHSRQELFMGNSKRAVGMALKTLNSLMDEVLLSGAVITKKQHQRVSEIRKKLSILKENGSNPIELAVPWFDEISLLLNEWNKQG